MYILINVKPITLGNMTSPCRKIPIRFVEILADSGVLYDGQEFQRFLKI